jgi:transposase
MAFLGLVPSERSTGETRKRGGITKTGNTRARKTLIEAAWTYRHSAGIGERHEKRLAELPEVIRDVAWKKLWAGGGGLASSSLAETDGCAP